MVASYSGHYDCVKELIMQGADINLQREKNSQASRYLGSSWRTDRHIYVRKLRDSESSHMMLKSGATALFLASQQGHNDIVKLLFEFGASTEFKTKDGGTALSAACQHGRSSVVETLLRNGAGMHDQLNDGATPLFLAAQEGHLTVIRQLLSSGAKVNHPREDGTTPLWMAAQMGHSEVVKVLLLRGAERDADRKVSIADPWHSAHQLPDVATPGMLLQQSRGSFRTFWDGTTALFKAAFKGHNSVVEELLKFSPSLGLLKNGSTALHAAVMGGNLRAVVLLLRANADPTLTNKNKELPADVTKNERILRLLRTRMVDGGS
ncbi:ankyrin repeat domain-containing protein 29 isoform X5 [Paramormyrops kingsleyae]